MRVLCAYCKKIIHEDPEDLESPHDWASHGICRECLEKEWAEFEREKEEE